MCIICTVIPKIVPLQVARAPEKFLLIILPRKWVEQDSWRRYTKLNDYDILWMQHMFPRNSTKHDFDDWLTALAFSFTF